MTENKKSENPEPTPSRGRPKLESGDRKSHIIQMRVSGEERDFIAAEALKSGKTMSEWLREKVLGNSSEL